MNSKEGGAFRPALLTLELENVYEQIEAHIDSRHDSHTVLQRDPNKGCVCGLSAIYDHRK